MAKYTETLLEYIEDGGILPSSSFALMGEEFENIFIERYAALEIGFETPNLFAVRLRNKAKIVCPVYAERLKLANDAFRALGFLNRWRYEKRTYGQMQTSTSSNGSVSDLPFNNDNAKASSKTNLTGNATTSEHIDEARAMDSLTPDELERLYRTFCGTADLILESCLKEFKPLFMGVY